MEAGWYLVELMGHRRIAGHVEEETIAGAACLRIDIPQTGDRSPITQYYSGAALYALTPVTEELARRFAERHTPRPVEPWDLPPERSLPPAGEVDLSDPSVACTSFVPDEDMEGDVCGDCGADREAHP